LAGLTAAVASSDIPTELLASELIYAPSDEGETPSEEVRKEVADLVDKLEEDQDTIRVWTTLP
jgi:translational activator of cytochrome c oxidase 1